MALPVVMILMGMVGCSDESSSAGESTASTSGTGAQQESPPQQAKRNPNRIQFLQCEACHAIDAGAPARVGPNLNCVIDRQAGALADFKYSDPFKQAASNGLIWDTESLSAFIENPNAVVPNSTMAFGGVASKEDRQKIIDYLASQCEP